MVIYIKNLIINDWYSLLETEFEKEYYLKLEKFVLSEYQNYKIYPPKKDIFNALCLTPYSETKVVIIGQDPYHGENQAHGLCFSVQSTVKIPPSLKNIYKELDSDIQCGIPNHGSLETWANQGVLMLNAVFTVRDSLANSHKNKGWEKFTDHIIMLLNNKETPVVFLLWGNNAQKKSKYITNPIHCIIKSSHPSPLSSYRGFFGSKPFSKTNEFLKSVNLKPVDWCIEKTS